jgi:enolase
MWLWIAIGLAAYAALMLLSVSMARAAAAADRSERRVFRAWLGEQRGRVIEHPVLRGRRPPKVA